MPALSKAAGFIEGRDRHIYTGFQNPLCCGSGGGTLNALDYVVSVYGRSKVENSVVMIIHRFECVNEKT
jgi:hypothetical protein